ncbi:YhfX family PLP-dependent enzyme [Sporolactobacillus sp. THM7-7]|nr:YhfX family PLP-dependent enzyme [Sporolactobacillus sp. THM7-7]
MFLNKLEERNSELINYASYLHKKGIILPDTYVLDLDIIKENTQKIVEEAKKDGIELFYMTKQFGRNPLIAKEIEKSGINCAVVVDYREAKVMMNNGLKLGNVGHLIQPPHHILEEILRYGSKYMTVFSLENLIYLNKIAKNAGVRQKVLLKVISPDDNIYPGQEGGFTLEELENSSRDFKALSHVDIAGLTSFPCILYDQAVNDFVSTNNVNTLKKAKDILYKNGIEVQELNMPSATTVRSLPLLKKIGGTQGEPGHALTGTTPMHAVNNLPEKPAICYVSEVSHTFNGHSFIYGGGYYRRGHLKHALVISGNIKEHARVHPLDNDSIDYYLELDREYPAGSTVIMSFRTQIFVTRSAVAIVSGLHDGHAELVGLYDSLGRKLKGSK